MLWRAQADTRRAPRAPGGTLQSGERACRAAEIFFRATDREGLRNTATGPEPHPARFSPLYRTDEEWAAEISNGTVHAVMHLTWVERSEGVFQGQMGVYVKPRGRLGAA